MELTNLIINALVIAGLLALGALPILTVTLCQLVRSHRACRHELARTKRRLADVEALRDASDATHQD